MGKGWLFDNISGRVDDWIRQWNRSSPERSKLAYGSVQRTLNWANEHYFRFLFYILLIAAFTGALFGWILPHFWGLQFLATDWHDPSTHPLDTFNLIWSIQATIAAIVYPVVLGFVTLMLGQRPSAKISLQLYMIDAAVLPAGLSAITLVAVMAFVHLFVLIDGTRMLPAAVFGAIFWLSVNALLTGWFLYHTLRFLKDEHRHLVLKQYSAHVIFPAEVRGRVSEHIFLDAQADRSADTEQAKDDEQAAIDRHFSIDPEVDLFSHCDGEPAIEKVLRQTRMLSDVRLRLFNWGVRLWKRSETKRRPQQESGAVRAFDPPRLQFCLHFGRPTSGKAVLCRVKSANSPGPLSRLLLKRSFVFAPVTPDEPRLSTREMLSELVGDLIDASRDSQHRELPHTFRNAVAFHISLIKCGQGMIDDEGLHNVAMTVDPHGWGPSAFHREWIEPYRDWINAAVNLLPDDPEPLQFTLVLSMHLIRDLPAEPIEIPTEALRLHRILMYRLADWRKKQTRLHSNQTRESARSLPLPAPVSDLYRRIMMDFVGYWEQTHIDALERGPQPSNPELAWKRVRLLTLFRAAKLEHTVHMLLEAVHEGDATAVHWLGNSFFRLFPREDFLADTYDISTQQNRLRNLSVLERPWAEVKASLPDDITNRHDERAIAELFATSSLVNYWVDLRSIAIMVLLRQIRSDDSDSLSARTIVRLARSEMGPELSSLGAEPATNPTDALGGFLRQSVEETYRDRLDKFVEESVAGDWPDMVPGRVELLSGVAGDITDLSAQRLQTFCVVSPGIKFDPKGNLYRRLAEELAGFPDSSSRVHSAVTFLDRALQDRRLVKSDKVVDMLRSQLRMQPWTSAHRHWVEDCVDWLRTTIAKSDSESE